MIYMANQLKIILFIFPLLILNYNVVGEERNKKFFDYSFESYFTFTSAIGNQDLPRRHSYNLNNLNLKFGDGEKLFFDAKLKAQKRTFSATLENDPYQVIFLPFACYDASWEEVFGQKAFSVFGKNNLTFQVGALENHTIGEGLFYSNFTTFGSNLISDFNHFSIIITGFGYGYDEFDDIFNFSLLILKKQIGFSLLYEKDSSMGSRLIPGLNFEIPIGNIFRAYGEIGLTYFYNFKNPSVDDIGIIIMNDLGDSLFTITGIATKFDNSREKTSERTACLLGVDINYKNDIFSIYLNGEIRYYGEQNNNFYTVQRNSSFNFFTDMESDLIPNKVPHDFYLYRGKSIGFFTSQKIQWNIHSKLNLNFKNEFLFVSHAETSKFKEKIMSNIFSIFMNFKVTRFMTVGAKLSNLLISDIENIGKTNEFDSFYDLYITEPTFIKENFSEPLLKSSGNLLFDLYLQVKF